MQLKNKSIIFFIIVFILLILRSFLFEQLLTKAFYDFDEARYAEIAKNTKITRNWLIPQSGGPDDPQNIFIDTLKSGISLHPYFWKPPLHPWIISILGPITELSVRLPSLIFSLLILVLIFSISKSIYPNNILIPYLSVILFSLSNDFSFISSQGIAEAQLLFFNLLCLYLLLKPSHKNIIMSGISLGLAIMTKSFATFWVFPLAIYLIYKHNPKKIFIWLLSIIIIAIPWHLFMYIKFGNIFISNYFLVNTIGRASGEQSNIAPIYWYLKYALWQWSTYVIFIPLVFIFFKKKSWFLLFWMALIIIPFSLFKSKVWWYIFPFWVPFCILSAYLLSLLFIKYRSITTVLFLIWILITSKLTLNQCKLRGDWNQGIKQLSIIYPNLTNLSVYKIPYESPLYYFNTGTISREITKNTNYIISNKDYYRELDAKQWQVIDNRLGDYLLKKI